MSAPLAHAGSPIKLRGVRVHNLQNIDLDLPSRSLIAFCGVSGSGKTSLALDTLYTEGQRRYIECFSAQSRQFFARLERPDVDRIDGLPPAVAIVRGDYARASRTTIGGATEIDNYLRLLFARCGRVFCSPCGVEVRRDTAATAARILLKLPAKLRLMIGFSQTADSESELATLANTLREEGYVRAILNGRTIPLADSIAATSEQLPARLDVIVDRLTTGELALARLSDSLETAFLRGGGRCRVFVEASEHGELVENVDGRHWQVRSFSTSMDCPACGRLFTEPEPRLYSCHSPLGACPICEGLGEIVDLDLDLIVPEPVKSIRDGAIAAWGTPAYSNELKTLIGRADELGIPLDVPFSRLTNEQVAIVRDGDADREYGGLRGFFARLEQQKHKVQSRVFLNRWKSPRVCSTCHGTKLRDEGLAAKIGGRNIAELMRQSIHETLTFFETPRLLGEDEPVGAMIVEQVLARLRYLRHVGLGYLTLDRTMKSLSGGEAQRVTLTSALGTSLVNMLYVLDEPSVGLHPRDVERLIEVVHSLRNRGNTVVVIEHEEAMLRASDHVVEVGPFAGERGGKIVFAGKPTEMVEEGASSTGDFMAGRRGLTSADRRRPPGRGWVRLVGARGNNLKNVTVEFPLGVLCLVTGVSGAGKSTLVQDTLYGALCHRKRKPAPKPLPFDDVFGDGQLDDIVMIDQSPIGRSARSNPVTYVKAFDEIRNVFADTIEARTRNYSASHFSFNIDGGRCTTCQGEGYLEVDMQFMADVMRKCEQCDGTRYRDEILRVAYRGRNIAEVLDMTAREAFAFFRGQIKVQQRLKRLIDVGLDYLRLGQPANTLSSGEAQRLKLASFLSTAKRNRTLFVMDEPTTGLHPADIVQLIDCFDALIAVGHSLVIVEHNVQLMKAADYIIDLGPGPADAGGEVVIAGTPEKIANCPQSVTGQVLSQVLEH